MNTMTGQDSNAHNHNTQLNSIINYIQAVTKELEASISDDAKFAIANELLLKPYDLAGAIAKHQPGTCLDELDIRTEVIARPRPMQIKLKSQDKRDNHISYFSFSLSPNVEDVEHYYDNQRSKVLNCLETSRLQQFLREHMPADVNDDALSNEVQLWESSFEHEHADLHTGVTRLLGSHGLLNENHSYRIKPSLLNYITPSQGAKAPYSLWLKLVKPENLLPFQTQYQFKQQHTLFAKLRIHSVFSYSIESGVDVVTLGIEYCSINVMEALPNSGYACIETLPVTVEDVREINYQLAHINQPKSSYQLYFFDTQTLSSPPTENSALHPKQIENMFNKRNQYLKALGVDICVQDTSQWLSVTKSIGSSFSLVSLFESLLPEGMFGKDVDAKRANLNRPLIYSQIQVEACPEIQKKTDLSRYFDRLRSQIAAVLNYNYIAASHTRTEHFGDIDIRSTVSRQGGCTIINNIYNDRQHNNQFISNSGKIIYLGAMVTAYIQYTFLNGIDQQYAFSLNNLNTPDALEKYAKLKNYLIHFRVNYTFTDISKLDIHNQAFEAWRKVFRLDALTKQLDQDVCDTSALLDTIYQQQEVAHNKSLRHLATIGTVIIFLTGLFGMNFHEFSVEPPRLFSLDWHLIVIALVTIGVWLYSESLTIRQSIAPRLASKVRRWFKR